MKGVDTMIFKDLIIKNKHKKDSIIGTLMFLYPDQQKNINEYSGLFDELIKMEVKENKDNMVISIREVQDEDSRESWEEVYGYKETEKNQSYALDLNLFGDWLGFKIDEDVLLNYSDVDFIAFCLYEMTFFGFTDIKIEEQIQELLSRIEEVESGRAKLIPWEEVMAELELNFKG